MFWPRISEMMLIGWMLCLFLGDTEERCNFEKFSASKYPQ